ncbi:SdpI family protein [Candidatus Latescibacterota bacterium]
MTWYHTLYILPGAFLILSILFIYEIIGPNETVGIRAGKAGWNEENWYKVHRFFGWSMLITSVVTYVYLAILYLFKTYISPDLDARTLYALGFSFFFIVGYTVIPIVYNASMPDSHSKEETSYNFDQLKSTFAVAIYVWLCFLFIFLAVHLVLNMVEPNTSSGIRVSTTLASEENWYKAHYFEGMATIIGSCITLTGIFFLKLFFRKTTAWYNSGLVYLLVFLIPFFISQFIAQMYIHFILKVP